MKSVTWLAVLVFLSSGFGVVYAGAKNANIEAEKNNDGSLKSGTVLRWFLMGRR